MARDRSEDTAAVIFYAESETDRLIDTAEEGRGWLENGENTGRASRGR